MYEAMLKARPLDKRYCKICEAVVNAKPLIDDFAKYMIQL